MYSVDGTPLDNPSNGWRLMRPTRPLLDLAMERSALASPGRHGTVPGMRAAIAPPILTFVVITPRAGLHALEALWLRGSALTYTGVPGKVAEFEFLSMAHDIHGPAMEKVELSVTVRLAGVFWRSATPSTSGAVALTLAATEVTNLFAGLSGDIQDAVVRVRGGCSGLQVTDSAGSWFAYSPALTTGQWLRFEGATGRAFITNTDSWSGGTEVSGVVDFNGPRGVFEISPYFIDPTDRSGRLTVTTATRSGASVQVRGRSAFIF